MKDSLKLKIKPKMSAKAREKQHISKHLFRYSGFSRQKKILSSKEMRLLIEIYKTCFDTPFFVSLQHGYPSTHKRVQLFIHYLYGRNDKLSE